MPTTTTTTTTKTYYDINCGWTARKEVDWLLL